MGCLREVEREAARRGLRSRRHVFAGGRAQGGGPLSRGQIHHILCNPVYAGRIRHKDRVFDGQHPAIIAPELWARVQARLQAASARPRLGGKSTEQARRSDAAPLTGKVRDPTGDRLTPSHTRKGGRRIRYYISNRLLSSKDPTGWRLPAERFEASVAAGVADHLDHMARRHGLLGTPDLEASRTLADRVQALVKRLRTGEHALLSAILEEARIGAGQLGITFDPDALADILQVPSGHLSDALLGCTLPFETRRRGVETRIVIGGERRAPDRTLLRALAKAHAWTAALKSGSPIAEIARREDVSQAFIRTRAQLACLSPRLQRAILDGTQPVDLTLERLVRGPLPLDWSEQERRYGLTDR